MALQSASNSDGPDSLQVRIGGELEPNVPVTPQDHRELANYQIHIDYSSGRFISSLSFLASSSRYL